MSQNKDDTTSFSPVSSSVNATTEHGFNVSGPEVLIHAKVEGLPKREPVDPQPSRLYRPGQAQVEVSEALINAARGPKATLAGQIIDYSLARTVASGRGLVSPATTLDTFGYIVGDPDHDGGLRATQDRFEDELHRVQGHRGEAVPIVHVDSSGFIPDNGCRSSSNMTFKVAEPQADLIDGLPLESRGTANAMGDTVGVTATERGIEVEGQVVLTGRDSIEALRDVISHYSAWHAALTRCKRRAEEEHDDADVSYYQHELNVLERVNLALRDTPLPKWKAPV